MIFTNQSHIFTLWVLLFILNVSSLLAKNPKPQRGRDEKYKQDLVERAKLAQETGRYGTMAKAMKQATETAIAVQLQLNEEEQYLLEFGYKIIIDARRNALGVIYTREQEEDLSENYRQVLFELKEEVEREQSIICEDVLSLMDSLLKQPQTERSQVFYWTLRGDYHRYYSEVKKYDEIEVEAQKARDMYATAYDISKRIMKPTNPIRIGIATKLSVLYNDILFSPREAYQLAKKAIEAVNGENNENLTDEELQNIEVLKTNMATFKQYLEAPEE